jgi:exosortase
MSTIPRETDGGAISASGPSSSPASVSLHTRGTSLRTVAIGSAIVLAAYLWIFWPFVYKQIRWAMREPADWGHTLVVPLIALYFVWFQRERLAAIQFRTTWIGLLPVILGVGWYLLCVLGPQPLWHHNLQAAGFGAVLFGLVLLLFGWRAMAILWFPIAYLVLFGQTISERFMNIITFKLQDIAAWGSFITLNVMGIETDRSGNTLTVWHRGEPHPLNIAEACSGMRMLVAFLAIGVAMAYTSLPRLWQQVLLVALGVPVAIAVNVLRVVTLGIFSLWDMSFVEGEFHTMIGLVWLIPAFIIYLIILWAIRQLVIEDEDGDADGTPNAPTHDPENSGIGPRGESAA